LSRCREISARQESATLAFTLATLIDDEASICFTAKRAVKIQDLEDSAFHAAREWKQRLVSLSYIVAGIFLTILWPTIGFLEDSTRWKSCIFIARVSDEGTSRVLQQLHCGDDTELDTNVRSSFHGVRPAQQSALTGFNPD